MGYPEHLFRAIMAELGDRPTAGSNLPIAAARLPADLRNEVNIAVRARFPDEEPFWQQAERYIQSQRDPEGFAAAEGEAAEEAQRDTDFQVDPFEEAEAIQNQIARRQEGRG